MKSISVIKSISIFLLVLLAFFQFFVIFSDNYSGFSNLYGAKNPGIGKNTFSYDYVSIESIRISDGENNFWDLDRKSDKYLQIKMAANEILKHSYTADLQTIPKVMWDELLSEKYIMVQYYCAVPLSFVSSYTGDAGEHNGLQKIQKMIVQPVETEIDIYIYDGSSYYKLNYDATQDHLLTSIDYDSIFHFVRYSIFYDESTYKLLGIQPTAYLIKGRTDAKLYIGPPQKYQLAINVTPPLISDISSLEDTYDLKALKNRLFGVIQDRYTSSISSNQTVFFSNMENQYAISHDGKITYDYFGKQSTPDRGNIDMAYNKALIMMKRVLGLMEVNPSASIILTDIDYSNQKHYTFCFDYLIDGGKLVYINQNPTSSDMQHAFVIQANQENVLKLTGLIRTILIDKGTSDYYRNDAVKLLTDHSAFISDQSIRNTYNGYILNAWHTSSHLVPALLLDCDDQLLGIPLQVVLFNSDTEDVGS